jgi:hypothetical protein
MGSKESDALSSVTNFRAALDKIHLTKGRKKDDRRWLRLASKLQIMAALSKRGVFLIDNSPVPIYFGGGGNLKKQVNQSNGNVYTTPKHKLPDKVKSEIMRTAFDSYVMPMIRKHQPQFVLIVGKTTSRLIGSADLVQLKDANCRYLGGTFHPSSNQLQSDERYLLLLRYLRNVSSTISGNTSTCADADLPKISQLNSDISDMYESTRPRKTRLLKKAMLPNKKRKHNDVSSAAALAPDTPLSGASLHKPVPSKAARYERRSLLPDDERPIPAPKLCNWRRPPADVARKTITANRMEQTTKPEDSDLSSLDDNQLVLFAKSFSCTVM